MNAWKKFCNKIIFCDSDGYGSSPERGGPRGGYEEPYYSQYGTRGGSVTPIIDEELRSVNINILFFCN